jgi:hypothetical protein
VAWGANLWVVVGSGGSVLMTSADGISWTARTSQLGNTGYSVAYNGTIFVAGGTGANTISTSSNGITWTGRGATIFNAGLTGAAWNSSLSLWVGTGIATSANTLATSPDGITWTGRLKTIFTNSGYCAASKTYKILGTLTLN